MKKNILNTLRYSVIPLFIVVVLLITPQAILANSSDKVKIFLKDSPLELKDLPAGRAVDRLNQLSPTAQQRALKSLQKFTFPAIDLESIHFDDDGGVFYVESYEINTTNIKQASTATDTRISAILPADTFILHSKAGSSNVVFLDFDGHVITGTAWNSSVATYNAKPFDIDGSPLSFNADELARIQEIWHRVSEDFAPFDIDVTTEEPAVFTSTTGRVLITHSLDESGVAMPNNAGGGVAYIGKFGAYNYDYYSPALVYYDHLGSGYPTYVAEASSHEFGHNLGLSHDGRPAPYNEEYYAGHGSGYVSWAPIMGSGYYKNVTQWSNGNYADSNNPQDDISIIVSNLSLSADDHGDDMANATSLIVEEDGSILVTNPETEDYTSPSTNNKGIIGSSSDVDYFTFYAEAGVLDISVTPAWSAFYRSSNRGANLDISLKLYNQAGSIIASSDPLDDTNATISEILATGGIYYIEISGVGNAVTPYNDYGSQGNYYISGSVAPAIIISPPLAPTSALATTIDYGQIDITWVDNATDESGYRIERSLDSTTWVQVATLLADTTSYSDTGLSASTEYFYRVVAFNSGGDTNSNTTSATTSQLIMVPIYFLLQ